MTPAGIPLLESLFLPAKEAFLALACGIFLVASLVIWGSPAGFSFGTVLAFTLSWAAVVDIRRRILPNALTIGLVVLGVAQAALQDPPMIATRVIGAAIGYSVIVAIACAYRRTRGRDGIGHGDAKLFAAAGAWLGWAALPNVLLFGSAAALACVVIAPSMRTLSGAGARLPFGPFLAGSFWIVWLFELVPELKL